MELTLNRQTPVVIIFVRSHKVVGWSAYYYPHWLVAHERQTVFCQLSLSHTYTLFQTHTHTFSLSTLPFSICLSLSQSRILLFSNYLSCFLFLTPFYITLLSLFSLVGHKTSKFKESMVSHTTHTHRQFNKPHIGKKIVGFSANFDERNFFFKNGLFVKSGVRFHFYALFTCWLWGQQSVRHFYHSSKNEKTPISTKKKLLWYLFYFYFTAWINKIYIMMGWKSQNFSKNICNIFVTFRSTCEPITHVKNVLHYF